MTEGFLISVGVYGGVLVFGRRSKKKERNNVDGFQRVNSDDRGTMSKRDSGLRNSPGSLALTTDPNDERNSGAFSL